MQNFLILKFSTNKNSNVDLSMLCFVISHCEFQHVWDEFSCFVMCTDCIFYKFVNFI